MDRLQRAPPFARGPGDSVPWRVPGRSRGTFVLLLAATLALAACGKVGPPQPVGPADKVIWPHSYPTPHPAP